MNLFPRQKETHRHGKHAYDYKRENRGEGRRNQEIGIDTLLYIK